MTARRRAESNELTDGCTRAERFEASGALNETVIDSAARCGICGRASLDVMHVVAIRGEMIRLGQFLKLAGVVDGGGEVKALLAQEVVTVNTQPETRRGRQLHAGDVVGVGVRRWRVTPGER